MNIQKKIKALGFTSAQIAEKMGITAAAFSQIVNGNPTLSRLMDIANAMGISVSELLRDSDEEGEVSESPRSVSLTIDGIEYDVTPKQ